VWGLARCAILLYLCAVVVGTAAVVGLWMLASRSVAIPNIESFIAQLFSLKKFRPRPEQLLLDTLEIGAGWVLVAGLVTVISGVVFNLISDVVGGIEVTLLEEVPLDKTANSKPTTGFLGLTALGIGGAPLAGQCGELSARTREGEDGR